MLPTHSRLCSQVSQVRALCNSFKLLPQPGAGWPEGAIASKLSVVGGPATSLCCLLIGVHV